MTPAELMILGRPWYDALVVGTIIAFFLLEAVLLFRNTLLGWEMTVKCVYLAGLFIWTLIGPVPVWARLGLVPVLVSVIITLIVMRMRRLTVVVGRVDAVPPVVDFPQT